MGRHAACMRPMRNVYSFSEEAIREAFSGYVSVARKIILKWVLQK